jgi:hypothetical protein
MPKSYDLGCNTYHLHGVFICYELLLFYLFHLQLSYKILNEIIINSSLLSEIVFKVYLFQCCRGAEISAAELKEVTLNVVRPENPADEFLTDVSKRAEKGPHFL